MHQELTENLDKLRDELAQGTPLGPEEREHMEQVLSQITDLLEQKNQAQDQPHSLVERLREAADQFEKSHPKLTMAIGGVADALSSIGI